MPGTLQLLVWLLCTLFEIAVIVCALKKGVFRRYALLSIYMGASVVVSLVRFRVLTGYGYTSSQYVYVYYYSDALLTIFLYFALANLYAQVLSELKAERHVRFATLFLLAATALFSYGVVHEASTRLISRFVVELSQNLYFVGLVVTYILWGAILKMRETRILCVLLPVADRGVRETAAVPGGAGGYGHTACCLGRRFQTGHAAPASLPRAARGSQRDSGSWRLFPIAESCSLNCGSMDSFYEVLDGLRAGPLYLFRSYRPRAAYLL